MKHDPGLVEQCCQEYSECSKYAASRHGIEAVLDLLAEGIGAATLATMDEVGVDEPVHHDEIDRLLVATVCQHFARRLLRILEDKP